jgi:hypothetical protein
VGALDLEMIEEPPPLRHVIAPGDAFDTAAGLAGLAPVEGDAGIFFREMIERLDLGIDALGRPFLDRGIEAARRIHQERRAGVHYLVARRDAVDDRRGHA